ncbi:MAG: hypothetical protein WD533_05435, partial [Dehalococcoidia bacterium]
MTTVRRWNLSVSSAYGGIRLLLFFFAFVLLATGCGTDGLPLPSFISRAPSVTLDASADLRILPPASVRLASVAVAPAELHVVQGSTAIFTASARDESEAVMSRAAFTWRMADNSAGSITSGGVFTAGDGTGVYEHAIVAEASQQIGDETITAEQPVTVVVHTGEVDSRLGSIVASPSTAQGSPGDRIPLRALGIGVEGGLVQDIELSWRILDDRAGSIDSNGLLTLGTEPGSYPDAIEVEARRSGSSDPPLRARASVYVLSPDELASGAQGVISPSLAVGMPDSSVDLSLFAFDSRGRILPVRETRWGVTDPAAGSISDEGRLVLGPEAGQYTGAVEVVAELGGQYSGEQVRAFADIVIHDRPGELEGPADLSVQMVPRTIRIRESDRERLNVVLANTEGRGASQVDWRSTTDAVSVDDRGRVTAAGQPGTYPGAVEAEARFS